MAEQNHKRTSLETITHQEEKILTMLREERRRTKEKFPLFYALVATFGIVATVSGFNKIIDYIPFLNDNPLVLIIVGLTILVITGTAYKKLG